MERILLSYMSGFSWIPIFTSRKPKSKMKNSKHEEQFIIITMWNHKYDKLEASAGDHMNSALM